MTRRPGFVRHGFDVGRPLLAVLLLAMAAGQLADPAGFADIIETYRLGGRAPAVAAVVVLIAGELAGGVGLLSRAADRRPAAATAAVAVAVAWTLLAIQAFVRHLAVDNCGCFGVYAGQTLRWWVLVEDAEFMALTLWVRVRLRPAKEPSPAAPASRERSADSA